MGIRFMSVAALLALTVFAAPVAAHPGVSTLTGAVQHAPLGLTVLHSGTSSSWQFQGTATGTESGIVGLWADMVPTPVGVAPSCNTYSLRNGTGAIGGHSVSNISGEHVNGTLTLTGTYDGGSPVTVTLDIDYALAECAAGNADSAPATGPVAFL